MRLYILTLVVFFAFEAACQLVYLARGDYKPTTPGIRAASIALCVVLGVWGLLLLAGTP